MEKGAPAPACCRRREQHERAPERAASVGYAGGERVCERGRSRPRRAASEPAEPAVGRDGARTAAAPPSPPVRGDRAARGVPRAAGTGWPRRGRVIVLCPGARARPGLFGRSPEHEHERAAHAGASCRSHFRLPSPAGRPASPLATATPPFSVAEPCCPRAAPEARPDDCVPQADTAASGHVPRHARTHAP
jgi:hypothetical protein